MHRGLKLVLVVIAFSSVAAFAKEARDEITVDDLGVGTEMEISKLSPIPANQTSTQEFAPKHKLAAPLSSFSCHTVVTNVSPSERAIPKGFRMALTSAETKVANGKGQMVFRFDSPLVRELDCDFQLPEGQPDRAFTVVEMKAVLEGFVKFHEVYSRKEAWVNWAKKYIPVIANSYKGMSDEQFRKAAVSDAYRKDYEMVRQVAERAGSGSGNADSTHAAR